LRSFITSTPFLSQQHRRALCGDHRSGDQTFWQNVLARVSPEPVVAVNAKQLPKRGPAALALLWH
jgi:hypothetical protein